MNRQTAPRAASRTRRAGPPARRALGGVPVAAPAAALCAGLLSACSGGSSGSGDEPVVPSPEELAAVDVSRPGDDAARVPAADGALRASVPVIGDDTVPVRRLGYVGLVGPLDETEIQAGFSGFLRPLDAARHDLLRGPVLDMCEVRTGSISEVLLGDVLDPDEVPPAGVAIDGGGSLTLETGTGTWSTVSFDDGDLFYGARDVVTGERPRDLTLTVPGGEFPAMRVAVPYAAAPEFVAAGGDGEAFDYSAPFVWVPGERPDTQWLSLELTAIADNDLGRMAQVVCGLVDDGSFYLPAEAQRALAGHELFDVLVDRSAAVLVRDGDAALYVHAATHP